MARVNTGSKRTRRETVSTISTPHPYPSPIHAVFLAANTPSIFDNASATSLVVETAACYCRKIVSTWNVQPFEILDGTLAPNSYSKGLLQELSKLAGTGIGLEDARQRLKETIEKRANARANGQYRKGWREGRQLTPGDIRVVIKAYNEGNHIHNDEIHNDNDADDDDDEPRYLCSLRSLGTPLILPSCFAALNLNLNLNLNLQSVRGEHNERDLPARISTPCLQPQRPSWHGRKHSESERTTWAS